MFSKLELKLLWPFYLEAFLGTLLFITPPFMVAYLLNLGFTASKIGVLMALAPLAAFIFEIPTGAIADLYGRKISTILGWLLEGILQNWAIRSESSENPRQSLGRRSPQWKLRYMTYLPRSWAFP